MLRKCVSLGIIRPAEASLHREPIQSRAAFDEMLRSTVANNSDHDNTKPFQVVNGRFKGIEKDLACKRVVEADLAGETTHPQRDG